jgi:hypothetical protein
MEDNDKLLLFLEEFIKKYQGVKGAKDILAYKELNEED